MIFQVTVLASGSSGNSVLIRSAEHAILLDAGIAVKRIVAALDRLNIDKELIRAVIVSHEHSDHTRSAGAISRALKIPVIMTRDTHMCSLQKLGNLHERLNFIVSGEEIRIGDIRILPFSSSHDAADSCNFSFQLMDDPSRSLGVATDLGYPTKVTTARLSGCTTLVLESNHDEELLMNGRYEPYLKQRIKSKHGHLSNIQAVGLISQILHPGLKNLVLAHLSEENNRPELAYQTMKEYLESVRSEINLLVAAPDKETPLLDI